MYRLIVFDLDGTLLDTLDDLTDAANAALAAFGFKSRTKAEIRAFIGNGIVKLMERACGVENYEHTAELVQAFKEYYKEHCADKTKPYEGIKELLLTLKQRGFQTAVFSNKADFAVKQLADVYFEGLLLEAVGEREHLGIRRKPAPEGLLAIMQEQGAAAEETLYVGDSEVDVQTAQNAGVDCVCVTWGFKDKEFLAQNGGERFADTPKDILSWL